MAKVPEGCNALSSIARLAAHISQRASGRRLYRSEQARTPAHEAWGRWAFVRGRADGRHRFASRQAPSWRIRSESFTIPYVPPNISAGKCGGRDFVEFAPTSNSHEFNAQRS